MYDEGDDEVYIESEHRQSRLINELKSKIYQTGDKLEGTYDSREFKCLNITEEDYETLNINEISTEDLGCPELVINVEHEGSINFISAIKKDSLKSLYYKGYIQKLSFTANFGKGVCAVNKNDTDALNIMKLYIEENDDYNSYVLVEGEYKGKYTTVVEPSDYCGLIVLEDSKNISNIQILSNLE